MTPKEQLAVLENIRGVKNFAEILKATQSFPLKAAKIEVLQINLGKKCNLSCKHCHVEAGPRRMESMSRAALETVFKVLKQSPAITTIDITGGAPELNPNLEWFLNESAKLNRRLIVRTNLVILLEEKYRKFIEIYARNKVEVVGSLPDYHPEKADRQRGKGSFENCIKALKLLNDKGYGKIDRGLTLDLVHNPVGAYLPASQQALEQEYKKRLRDEYGVVFNQLFCIANIPIGRYLEYLLRTDNYTDYVRELFKQYNPRNVPDFMCRSMISVGWDGKLYDCDFNQMLGLTVFYPEIQTIDQFDYDKLSRREIVVLNHCYGCAAGSGSSCQGCFE